MNTHPSKKHSSKKLMQNIGREGLAFFWLASTLIGALFSGYITVLLVGTSQPAWPLMAIAGSIIILPKVFAKNKDTEEPYLIRFARAFREGFVLMYSTTQNLPEFIGRLRTARGAAKTPNGQNQK